MDTMVQNITLKQTEKGYFPKLPLSTNLRLPWHKSETTLTSLADFFRYQRATPQGNPHRDHLIILIFHDARLQYIPRNRRYHNLAK